MIKLEPPVDKEKYKEIPRGLSEYDRNKVSNTPTHFTLVLNTEGRYKGFDKVTYYRENLLEKVARSNESSYI